MKKKYLLLAIVPIVLSLALILSRESKAKHERQAIPVQPVVATPAAETNQVVSEVARTTSEETAPVVQNPDGTFTVTDSGGSIELVTPRRDQSMQFVPETVNKARIEAAIKQKR